MCVCACICACVRAYASRCVRVCNCPTTPDAVPGFRILKPLQLVKKIAYTVSS